MKFNFKQFKKSFISTVLLFSVAFLALNIYTNVNYYSQFTSKEKIDQYFANNEIIPNGTKMLGAGSVNIKALVVGGGGGGRLVENRAGGGGGGGEFIYNSSFAVSYQQYSITVGAGGDVNSNGGNSIFSSITASGGIGSPRSQDGGACPNGGGGGLSYYTNSGAGGGGAGGGGANSTSGGGGNGGIGRSSDISGSTNYYSGGGGGGGSSYGGTGGNGGGGNGGYAKTAGQDNTGGGGGGGVSYSEGSVGGSGIVILRWKTSDFGTCSITGTGNTITTNGSDTIATFITSGTITFAPVSVNNSNFFLFF